MLPCSFFTKCRFCLGLAFSDFVRPHKETSQTRRGKTPRTALVTRTACKLSQMLA